MVDTVVVVAVYVGVLSTVAFVAASWDKLAARRQASRVPERRLLLFALAGGTPGLVVAMLLWRHKTSKASFKRGVWLVFVVQVTAIALAVARYRGVV